MIDESVDNWKLWCDPIACTDDDCTCEDEDSLILDEAAIKTVAEVRDMVAQHRAKFAYPTTWKVPPA